MESTLNDRNTSHVRLPNELPLETPFWAFSLAQWKNQAAQTALLSLQNDMGLIVNRLLFCSWLGFERRELLTAELFKDALLSQWHDQSVAQLRALRVALKTSASHQAKLIATVQSAELQAEQIEQALLFQKVDKLSKKTTQRNTLATLSFNLLGYTQGALSESKKEVKETVLHSLLITLIQATIPNHDRSHIEAYFHDETKI